MGKNCSFFSVRPLFISRLSASAIYSFIVSFYGHNIHLPVRSMPYVPTQNALVLAAGIYCLISHQWLLFPFVTRPNDEFRSVGYLPPLWLVHEMILNHPTELPKPRGERLVPPPSEASRCLLPVYTSRPDLPAAATR